MRRVLISGGTGMIGRALVAKLHQRQYKVNTLSRHPAPTGSTPDHQFKWNPSNARIDPSALDQVKAVIHLAGAGIADKRWTKRRKQEIVSSRVDSANLLKRAIADADQPIDSFISASGANYYGTHTSDQIFSETDDAGNDFLATCCVLWEQAALENNPAERVAILRTPMVLSNSGGALPKLAATTRFGLGAVLGSGKQYAPWIHLDDLTNMYIHALENELVEGAYNAVADEQITHQELMQAIAHAYYSKIRLPKVPKRLLHLALGEMSNMLLEGSRLSNKKIKATGYDFRYPNIDPALKDVIKTP